MMGGVSAIHHNVGKEIKQKMMKIDKELGTFAIYGGLLLGGGGGGSIAGGKQVLELMLSYSKQVEVLPIDAFEDEAMVVSASLVGSPASKDSFISPKHYGGVFDLLKKNYHRTIQGIITNEMGAQSSTNGWVLAAMTGLPLIDAPCNGRAHPTGIMGSLCLHKFPEYRSVQVCAGGNKDKDIQLYVQGNIQHAAQQIRNASTSAGGFVTVLRNPVSISHTKRYAAIGAFSWSIQIGKILYENLGNVDAVLDGLKTMLPIQAAFKGKISSFKLKTLGGFDRGKVTIKGNECEAQITFWNEYIDLELDGTQYATFPDLIVLIDTRTGMPLTSDILETGQEVMIAVVPKTALILGKTMYDSELLEEVKQIINEIKNYEA